MYDVFINFRGEDTRKTFTSLLYEALCKENIYTYIDNDLDKGDDVWPSLAAAIRNSRISVVVFSENYASSKWCLVELAYILGCRQQRGQVVIPVFYETDPADVRKQTGSHGRAFARHEAQITATLSSCSIHPLTQWKSALTDAANISGWDSRNYREISRFIKDIVKDVLEKLSLMYPNELKDLVQIDENNKYIESLLRKHQRIGIWAMSGMGKTTMAKQMFAKHFPQYDSVCLLENVREESKKFGLTHVCNKLLSELLKRPITTSDAVGLHTSIKRRLSGKKVFIVLDDVDDREQLEDIYRELGDLGPDSRLIITTRDKHVIEGRVDEIYRVKKWKFEESLKLFSLGAFKQSHPKEGYERPSKKAVEYAGGVPLALKVLGSHFSCRDPKFWEDELNHLQNSGESLGKIQKVLEESYNGLSAREKEMFLDIAFFFKDENKDFVSRILDGCGFNATSGITLLEDKALVTISNNRIQMHDLLQKMALDMVLYKKYHIRRDPGERSRLRDIEEVRDVLKNNQGTHNKVEGIIADLSQKVKLHIRADTFNMMTELRFLRLYVPLDKKRSATVSPPEDILPFCDKLRYLEWNGYPLKSLPQPFCAELLVEIRLPHSDVEHLWHGTQELVNLEAIDLSECKQLIELPDLSGASKLKWLYLSGCESLCEVQSSIFSKDTLVTLLLDRCVKLRSLTSEKHLTSLEKISVYGCSSLKGFVLSSDSIESLDLSNTGIEILHSSIGGMSKLVWLSLAGLSLANLPKELSCLRSLTELWLSNCNIVTKLKLEAVFYGRLGSLKVLYLNDCGNLLELPANISSLSRLYELRLDGSSVERLPTSIKYLSKLEILSLSRCRKLRCLPELPPHIKEFHADNCTSLVKISTLKTFSKSMKGENKYISFKNDMELDRPSLDCMTEDAILTMKSAALHNMSIEKYSLVTHSYNFDSVVVVLPGSSVPRQFKYRSTDSSSITVERPEFHYSRGLILSVVLSPSHGTREHGNGVQIQCQCYLEDGGSVGFASKWHHKAITNVNMDNVFLWYDPYHFHSICNFFNPISFEFSVTTDTGERDGFFSIKECGISPIDFSEFPSLIGIPNLDEDLKSYLLGRIPLLLKLNEVLRLS